MNNNDDHQSSTLTKRQRTLHPLPNFYTNDLDMNDVQSSRCYKEWSSLSDGEVFTKYGTNFIKGDERDEQRLICRIHTQKADKCNYNINVITSEELNNRNHKSEPIYFTKSFIPCTRINRRLSIHHINDKMVHTFLSRDQQHIGASTPVRVNLTDSRKMTVLQSMLAFKTFFRAKGSEFAKKTIIDYYNKHYLQKGSQNIKQVKNIFDRENDMSKVCI